jgi:hypothetical protein
MRLVYKHANRAIVWLGPLDAVNQMALERAQELCAYQDMLAEATGIAKGQALSPEVEELVMEAMTSDGEQQSLQSLLSLFEGQYFRRVWCIQEVVVSRAAIAKSGDFEMDFFDLLSLVKLVLTKQLMEQNTGPIIPQNTLQFWAVVHKERDNSQKPGRLDVQNSLGKIRNVLTSIRDFQSTDPRDRIFAVLGITDEGQQPILAHGTLNDSAGPNMAIRGVARFANWLNSMGPDIDVTRPQALKPDYSKPTMEVYRDFTRYMIRVSPRVLNILSHVQRTSSLDFEDYPSWVPRFDTPRSVSFFPAGFYWAGLPKSGRYRYYAVMHDNSLHFTVAQPNILQLDGFIFDTVIAVTDPVSCRLLDVIPVQQLWGQLFDNVSLFPRPNLQYTDGSDRLDVAFFLTICACAIGGILGAEEYLSELGNNRFNAIQQLTAIMRASLLCWLCQVRGLQESQYPDVDPAGLVDNVQTDPSAQAYQRAAWSMSVNRRLYRTRAGFLGLGPTIVEPGDVIVVLYGGHVPFVLRPAGQYWKFVGETYLHHADLMDGTVSHRVREGNGNHQPMTFKMI